MEFNVADLIERVAKNVPDREAVICGNRRATYKHFDESSKQFARYLLSIGLGKGDHIGIYAYNSIEWIESMIACYKIGAVPINMNYRYVEEELRYLIDDADLKAILYDTELSERLNNVRGQLPLLKHFVHFDDAGSEEFTPVEGSVAYSTACKTTADVTFPPRSTNDRYMIYTGGTTGMPKGVVWTQGDAIMIFGGGINMYTQEPAASPEAMADRCLDPTHFAPKTLNMAPLMHGAAQWGILRAIFEGGTVVMLSKKSFDAHEVWQQVEAEGVNVIMVTGDAMAKPLMDAFEEGNTLPEKKGQPYNASSILAFASTSAIFSPSLKDKFAEKIPTAVITDNIGSSESGFTGTTVHEKGKAETNAGGPRVTPAKNVVVLDDAFNLIAAGDERIGQLAKSGYVPIEYYKDPIKSAATFVTAPDGKRYTIPGDMARHNADGTITMLGRGSLCINSGGEKIYPEEVEMAIKAHLDVSDCLVAATPDERFGSCVTALVQLNKGAKEPSLESIHEACKTHIARYKVPRRVYFVEQIKRAPSGKADYKWAKDEAMRLYQAETAA
jgi:acyl-CoA synthetase (AMP-forming)/AMP-acid ligase II